MSGMRVKYHAYRRYVTVSRASGSSQRERWVACSIRHHLILGTNLTNFICSGSSPVPFCLIGDCRSYSKIHMCSANYSDPVLISLV